MHCPTCSRENPPQARFCLQCGARLTLLCPQCHTELPPDARFCLSCGAAVAEAAPQSPEVTAADLLKRHAPKEYVERLLATRGQPHDERRTVTILFADVKGSTAMADKLDPEDVKEIMHGALEVLISPIYRYEGTLARLMGDAILALFGAPIAHEDDPERAIRAALEITTEARRYGEKLKRERGIEGFAVRVGINTGLVVVGEVGTDLRVEYTAMGDAVNLAARMESAAEPGTVLVTESTFKLVARLFETQASGPLQVKGKAEPVLAYRILAAKPAQGKMRGIAGLESPLVGREAEFAALREALRRLRSGVGGIVTIVGEAGLGKSRLVAEMRKAYPTLQEDAGRSSEITQIAQIDRNAGCSRSTLRQHGQPAARAEDDRSAGCQPAAGPEENRSADYQSAVRTQVQWVEGRCLSYGASIAYLLWLDVLRSLLGVTVEDSPTQVRDRLRERVQALCGESTGRHFAYLTHLMSLPLDAETEAKLRDEDGQRLKSNTFEAVEALLRCAATQRPLVLVFEDLHWADPTSLELLERIVALTDCAPLLLLCVFRPDREHGSWQLREAMRSSRREHYADLELAPLSTTDSQALVGNLLGVDALPADLRQRIVGAAEGNPFYVEEVIRGLMDSGAISREEASGPWVATRELAEIVIPDTLQGVLLARLDRLQEDAKRVLQMAAVIGRVFLYRVLAAIAAEERDLDGHLLTLRRQELIRERARLPELEYIFKHELTREAAYNGILKKERRAFHRQVAEALEGLLPERIEEQLGLLAHHWERAGDARKATDYLLRAGDQARLAYSNTEAIGYYQRALAFLKGDAEREQAARTWMKLGLTYHNAFDFDRSDEAYGLGLALWQQSAGARSASRSALPTAPHAFRVCGLGSGLPVLDPGVASYIYDSGFIQQLFSGLVELTPEMDVVPDAAEGWEVLEDGSKYVFHLRNDMHWSDGVPVTAGDFEYAWKRILHPATKTRNAADLYDVRNARSFREGRVVDSTQVGVRSTDPHTLIVELEAPAGYFLNLLAATSTFPIPRHAVEALGSSWAEPETIVTNGPFLVRAPPTRELLVLERNPDYQGPARGNVQRVECRLLPAPAEALDTALYQADRLDALWLQSGPEIERMRRRHAADYRRVPELATSYLGFGTHRCPCDNVRVRRALAMSIDRARLPAVCEGVEAQAKGGFVPPGMWGHSPGIGLPFDPEGARRLLGEAGYRRPGGLSLMGLCSRGSDVAASLQEQWRQNLGIDVYWQQPDSLHFAIEEALRTSAVDMFLAGFVADYPDPDNFLRLCVRGSYPSGWLPETYERLVEEARRSTDQDKRIGLYREADRILVQQAAVVPLTHYQTHLLLKPWIDAPLSPVRQMPYKHVIIRPH